MTTAAYPIDLDNPNAYELLSVIVDEFEKAALRSETRAGILIVSKSPLSAMDQMLEGSEKTLRKTKEISSSYVADKNSAEANAPGTESQAASVNSTPFGVEVNPASDERNGPLKLPPEVNVKGGAGFDADLLAVMQKGMKKKGAEKLEEAIQDCLGCELSLKFDWQLKPFNLLGPISDMLSEINAALDKLGNMLDPLNLMRGFCNAMNDFSLICLKDWIAILMALKALLKKYLSFSLDLKLDWSIILGPILKLIVEAFLSLVEQMAGLVIAPLDCAISVLDGLEDLERAAQELGALAADFPQAAANQVNSVGQQVAGRNTEDNIGNSRQGFGGTTRDVAWTGQSPNDPSIPGLEEWNPGRLRTRDRTTQQETGYGNQLSKQQAQKRFGESVSKTFSFPTGVEGGINVPLDQQIGSRDFLESSIFNKLGNSVKEAKQFILDLVRKLQMSFRSLNGLVAGGLSIQIGNLGVILLIKDLIGMVMKIINLLSDGIPVKDWCKYIEENPSETAKRINGTGGGSGGGITAFVDDDGDLAFAAGPRYTMKADTCISNRSETQGHILNQWIKDLEGITP